MQVKHITVWIISLRKLLRWLLPLLLNLIFLSLHTTSMCVVCSLVLPYRDCGCLLRRCVYLSAAVSTGQAIRLSRDNGPEIRAEEYQLSELRVVSDVITTPGTVNWPPKRTCTKYVTLEPTKRGRWIMRLGAGRSQRSPEYCQRDFEPLCVSLSPDGGITIKLSPTESSLHSFSTANTNRYGYK
jgi:hypothetical protein